MQLSSMLVASEIDESQIESWVFQRLGLASEFIKYSYMYLYDDSDRERTADWFRHSVSYADPNMEVISWISMHVVPRL